jgi:dTDP-4-dehydrorhamnose 3,5-epimerase
MNNSLSSQKGTLRGLHYQLPPSGEVKVVRCIRGALWDVIVDLRPDSPSYLKWFGEELTAENRKMMYVPRGFAHALITLTEDTEALYLVSNKYDPARERGVRWNDQAIGIDWPIAPVEISEKDGKWPDLDPEFHGLELMRGVR